MISVSQSTGAWSRQVYLVRGYHNQSYPPAIAYDAGLRCRFAIVLQSWRDDSPDALFDSEFFLMLAGNLRNCLEFDTELITTRDGIEFRSLTSLASDYAAMSDLDCDAPVSMHFCNGKQLVCVERTEFWCECGGPDICHDSYTFAFHTATDQSQAFLSVCRAVCAECKATVVGELEGIALREPFFPWYRAPLKLLGVKPW